MATPLVGCPHCRKPITFEARLAGKVIGCPHCGGKLTMPAEPPPMTPPPPSAAPTPQGGAPAQAALVNQGSLRFEAPPPPITLDQRREREPWHYSFLANYTSALLWLSIAAQAVVAIVVLVMVIVPAFRLSIADQNTARTLTLIVASLGLLLALVSTLLATLMVVSLLRLAIDTARHIRAMRYRLDESVPTRS